MKPVYTLTYILVAVAVVVLLVVEVVSWMLSGSFSEKSQVPFFP